MSTISDGEVAARFVPAKRVRVHDDIVEQLIAPIREGKVLPGDKLPSERELAEAFGVSRASVRGVLRALEMAGIVECRRGDGTYVARFSAGALAAPLSTIIASQQHAVTELMEVRDMIEPSLAAKAALRATEHDIRELKAILLRQRERVNRGEFGVDEDNAFHYAIARACQNGFMMRVMELAMTLLQETRAQWLLDEERARISVTGHQRILEAIENGDADGAFDAMRGHISEVTQAITGTASEEARCGEAQPDLSRDRARGLAARKSRPASKGGGTGRTS